MQLEQPPILHDGGYWYVVPVVTDATEGGLRPDIEVADWCAWYSGDLSTVLIRTPTPVAGLKTLPLTPNQVINTPMPRGRVRGV